MTFPIFRSLFSIFVMFHALRLAGAQKEVVRVGNMFPNVPGLQGSYCSLPFVLEAYPPSEISNITFQHEWQQWSNPLSKFDTTIVNSIGYDWCDVAHYGASPNKVCFHGCCRVERLLKLARFTYFLDASYRGPCPDDTHPRPVHRMRPVGRSKHPPRFGTELGNRDIYPMVLETMPTDIKQGRALAHLLNKFEWRRVGVLALSTSDMQSVVQGLLDAVR